MSGTVCIKGETLAAALLAAPKDDVRYYLNGAYIESNEHTTRTVVTNGHYMYLRDEQTTNTFDGHFIVPRVTLELVKAKTGFWYIDVLAPIERADSISAYECQIRNASGDVTVKFTSIQGVFPNYTRVMPTFRTATDWFAHRTDEERELDKLPTRIRNYSGDELIVPEHVLPDVLDRINQRFVPCQFDPSYIALAHKIAKLSSKNGTFKIFHNGNGSSLVKLPYDQIMVLMPMKNEDTLPSFEHFKEKLPQREQVKDEIADGSKE